jgi:hypothetical protein
MERDKPYRIQQQERHEKHNKQTVSILEQKDIRSPSKPPTKGEGKQHG